MNLSIERDSAVLDGHALTKGLFVKSIVQIHEPPSLRVGGKVKAFEVNFSPARGFTVSVCGTSAM